MKLYANGCSFTAGNDDVHDADGRLMPPADYTWPYMMPVEHVINESRAGGNNDRILRKTMDYFTKNNSDNHIAVIQWTSPVRFERYFPMFDCWAEFCNVNNLEVNNTLQQTKLQGKYSLHADNGEIISKFFDNSDMNYDKFNLIETATKVLAYAKEINDYIVDFYKTIILMQQFLDSKNVPYIFTSMSFFNHIKDTETYMGIDKFDIINTNYETNLYKCLDQSVWNNEPCSAIAKNDVFPDRHPNEDGHILIANNITSEFKKRGIL